VQSLKALHKEIRVGAGCGSTWDGKHKLLTCDHEYDESNWTLCVCKCFLTLDFCANARPQTMHWKGFSPVWQRVCCCRSKFFVNNLSQYWQCSARGATAADVLLASATDGFMRLCGSRLMASLFAAVVTDVTNPCEADSTKHTTHQTISHCGWKYAPTNCMCTRGSTVTTCWAWFLTKHSRKTVENCWSAICYRTDALRNTHQIIVKALKAYI